MSRHLGQKSLTVSDPSLSLLPTGMTLALSQSNLGQVPNSEAMYLS